MIKQETLQKSNETYADETKQKHLEILFPRPQNLSEIEKLHWEWQRRMMEFVIANPEEYEIEEKRVFFVAEHMNPKEGTLLLLEHYAEDPRAEVACGLISAIICIQYEQPNSPDIPLLFTYEGLTKMLIAELLFNDIQASISAYRNLESRNTAGQIEDISQSHQDD